MTNVEDIQKQIDKLQEHVNRIGGTQMDIVAFLEKVLNDKSALIEIHKKDLSKISKT